MCKTLDIDVRSKRVLTYTYGVMNKYLYTFFIALLLWACQDEEEKRPLFLKTELEENILNIPTDGKSEEIEIYTNVDMLTLSSAVQEGYDWCQIEVVLTATERQMLLVTVDPNKGINKRGAEFTLSGQGVESIQLKIMQLGTTPDILVDSEKKSLTSEGQEFSLKVTTNVDCELTNNEDWLQLLGENSDTRGMAEKNYRYKVSVNKSLAPRRDTIYIKTMEDETPLVVKVPIEQNPGNIDDVLSEDIKLEVITEVKLTQGEAYKPVADVIDGKLETFFSSKKNSTVPNQPVILEFTVKEGTERVDYVVLHQNPIANNTNQLTKGTLYYKSDVVPEWTECATFGETAIVPNIRLKVEVANPLQFKLELERTKPEDPKIAPNVSLAEFECYQYGEGGDFDLEADKQYFENDVFSMLKSGVTVEDINKITHPMVKAVAQELLNETYEKEFRVRTYQSCKDPAVVGKELTIGKRSICDNPTGLFFEKDKKSIVFVSSSIGKESINLYIKDWRENGGQETIALKAGLNVITPTVEGMGYIQYWTNTNVSLPEVEIHVCFGNEIGFWDVNAGHTNEDWRRILAMALDKSQQLNITNAMMDVLGKHVQLINTVNAFNTHCPADIVTVMEMHDQLMFIEYSIMGLVKYETVPQNRMLGVRSWGSGNPNWNGTSGNFPNSELNMLNKAAFLNDIWLFGHEFGHGNQIGQMKEAGWAEVTNNLYTQEAMYRMNNGQCRIEHGQYKRPGYGDNVYGDRFNEYFHESIINKEPYLTHGGELKNDERGEYYSLDAFMTLAPLWQLSLFFQYTESAPWYKPDFWADVHWNAILDKTDTSSNYGLQYMNFMKRCMDATGYNLCDFFEKMGLLHKINMKVGGYGTPKRIEITEAMINEIRTYGQKFAAIPGNAMLHYISGNSLEFFKKRQSVQGTYGQGITDRGLVKIISHDIWKNAVVYETYKNDELLEITISGTGTINNSSTLVRYPEGATCIEAVAWNGEKTLVFGSR